VRDILRSYLLRPFILAAEDMKPRSVEPRGAYRQPSCALGGLCGSLKKKKLVPIEKRKEVGICGGNSLSKMEVTALMAGKPEPGPH
jgi:hypothetical protein